MTTLDHFLLLVPHNRTEKEIFAQFGREATCSSVFSQRFDDDDDDDDDEDETND